MSFMFGPIAHLVERLICNEEVRSSSLLGSTSKKESSSKTTFFIAFGYVITESPLVHENTKKTKAPFRALLRHIHCYDKCEFDLTLTKQV